VRQADAGQVGAGHVVQHDGRTRVGVAQPQHEVAQLPRADRIQAAERLVQQN